MISSKKLSVLLVLLVGIICFAKEDIAKRRNVASTLYGTTATAISADGTKQDAMPIISGSHSNNSAVCVVGTPGVFEMTFSQPEEINLIRLYPGHLGYATFPSGECGLKSYRIERWNNGYYLPLAEAEKMPSYAESGATGEEDYFFEHVFEPVKALKVRITVTESGHSGHTASSPAPVPVDKRASYLRAVEVYSTELSDKNLVRFSDAVTGDFKLTVWRNQPEAILALTCALDNELPVHVTVSEELSGKEISANDTRLVPGKQDIVFPLDGIANGRYIVKIVPKDSNSSYQGYIHRMLRVDKQPRCIPPEGTYDVSGMRIFPVDDFHFEVLDNVKVRIHSAEPIEISKRMGYGIEVQDSRSSNYMGKDANGTYYFRFNERDKEGQRHYFVSTSSNLKDWTTIPEEKSKFQIPYVRNPYAPIPAPAAKIKRAKTAFEKAKIRKFDRAKDAPFELNEVIVQWFPPYSWDVKSKGLIEWSTYPMIERGDEWLLLTEKPLFVERFDYTGDSLECDIDCNDNFGTQYFLDDGKTLCYGKAGKLRVFDPMAVKYDNLSEAYRIMRVYYTHDGFNWQYEYFCPPDEKDPWGWQSYGYNAWRVDRDFWLALNFAYDCGRQQVYPEICYSHDGIIYERFDDRTPFVKNTPINTWLFGMIFMDISCPFVDDDGYWFLPLGSGRMNPHFYPYSRSPEKPYTAEEVKRSFGGRNLKEQWPFFEQIGGWQGLAESFTHYLPGNVCGIVRFRADGYFATRADENGGRLVSRVFTAPGNKLVMNFTGRMKIALLDEAGKPLEGFTAELDGDKLAEDIVWQNGSAVLPSRDFKVAVDLAPGAEIYCFRFLKK